MRQDVHIYGTMFTLDDLTPVVSDGILLPYAIRKYTTASFSVNNCLHDRYRCIVSKYTYESEDKLTFLGFLA